MRTPDGELAAPLPREFFRTDARRLASALLGCVLLRQTGAAERCTGRIVETEAYVGVKDRASHAFGGRRTARNASMYARAGTAYVYFTYGMHHCFNVVCGEVDEPAAVLIRALEPIAGIQSMRARRGESAPLARLCAGPGNLCRAMAIGRDLDGHDLCEGAEVWIQAGPATPLGRVDTTARIGVDSAGAWAARRLRWVVTRSPSLSVRPPGLRRR